MVRPYIDEEKCIGCLKCVYLCPVWCFIGGVGENQKAKVEDPDECLGCDICTTNCNQNAIEIKD